MEVLEKMELWNDKVGSIPKAVAVPVDCNENGTPAEGTKFVKLYLSQWVNDIKVSKSTRIGLGTTGRSMLFSGWKERINRVWGTKPQTAEEIKESREKDNGESFLTLWSPSEGSTPQSFDVEDKNGTITLVISSSIDADEDMQHINIQLGNTGRAIRISPVQGTVRQTEVSVPFIKKVAEKMETIVL